MSPPLVRVESDETLPAAADVVVIGGGIVGVCTAYTLARRGISVALVEKGRIGAEQSSRNWGWCRQLNRDERELPIATRSLEIWGSLAADIGEDAGFRRCGLIYLSNDEEEVATWSAWSDFARPRGVDTRILTAEAATGLGRATGRRWKGGVHSPTDGTADPSRAAPVIARGIRKHGGTVHQSVAARGIETAGGRISGVVTEAGTIRASTVVMAGGAWASSFCRQLGIVFPQAAIRLSVVRLAAGADDVPGALYTPEAAIARRCDGSFTIAMPGHAAWDPTPQALRHAGAFLPMLWKRRKSLWAGNMQGWLAGHETLRRWRLDEVTPMERTRILDPRPGRRIIAETVRKARAVLPAFERVEPVQAWAGYIDSTPDGVPVISGIDALPGFVLAAGFSGHGFGIGPGAGELAADIATGRAPALAAAFRLDRFAHRQKISEF